MKIRPVLILACFFMFGKSFGQASMERKFDPLFSSEVMTESSQQVSRELDKEVAIVRFVKVDNPRIELEIEMWSKFLTGIDRQFVGFLFVLDYDSDEFRTNWAEKMPSDIPLILDSKGLVKQENEVGEDYGEQTLILGEDLKILTATGSPIILDNFDMMRSVLGHELKNQGYTTGVKGPINDPDSENRTWLMGEPIYMTQAGIRLTPEEFKKLLESGQFYPEFTFSDTVKMIRRK